ncbi:MAG TPA: carboxymuconolactone decarboxylase family protein [Dinghuibacter sp.]|uniref:carboxymuconolactone decarboxylase family protein n=1 Tax=Dinghuibacter sp. TaxID=2024697 RepID=UPI002CB5DAD8|nr:carboxymuconolactone decarboxylase family protein [Dinghuibacter sp.]HTJ13026.1 carboxymuconolactone decarboxylase family protein [Dinghuibacter sp.]
MKTSYENGRDLLERLHGGHLGERMVNELNDVCPDFVDMTLEWALDGIMNRPGMDLKTRELLLIASCVTLGGTAAPQLHAHIDAALTMGAGKEEIVETILQMLFYAGGVNVSNAFRVAKEVFKQRNI